MSKQLLFIYNPKAGRQRIRNMLSGVLEEFSAQGYEPTVHPTQEGGEAERVARDEGGSFARVVCCGGDGTLNEVASGAAGWDNAAVTAYSGGSGNDFVKIFDQPKAFYDLERLLDARETAFDLIRCNDDFSLNICSVGLDARIGTDVSRYKRIPLLQGFRAYAASTLVNIIRGISEHYVVEINGETIDDEQTFVCVCNGRFYGGGFNPVPEADPTDGLLDVLLVRKVHRLEIPAVIGKYKNGRYAQLPDLVRHFRTDHITIHCDKPTPINLDGELRTAQVVDMSVAREKVRFFYPKELTWQR